LCAALKADAKITTFFRELQMFFEKYLKDFYPPAFLPKHCAKTASGHIRPPSSVLSFATVLAAAKITGFIFKIQTIFEKISDFFSCRPRPFKTGPISGRRPLASLIMSVYLASSCAVPTPRLSKGRPAREGLKNGPFNPSVFFKAAAKKGTLIRNS
ncbi:hypothetical protein, partial [Saccharicrinis sp. GN24d3]|uniref:hypothetical protein n=1 Tax=Saccharicrinis sp. GN24d3 TaxID=3458416 RepID=UPI004036E12C